jgi:hypothetical protein
VRHPALAPLLLPPGRTLRAFVWCARHARGELPFLAVAWPAYLAMAGAWAWGFRAGVRDEASHDVVLAPSGTSP